MDDAIRPDVVFQQSLVSGEYGNEKWPHLKKLITSRDELAAAYERAARDPKWKQDPLLAKLEPGTAKEILDFYNAVVADGRYVAELQTDPQAAARKLRLDISDRAFETIKSLVKLPGDNTMSVVAAAVVVSIAVVGVAAAVAVANAHVDPRKQIVIDESGIVKV
jgi:hypothetical protein